MKNKSGAETQLILNEVYDKVAAELEKEFYPKLGFKSEKITRGYFRMSVIIPLAQKAVTAILNRLFEKNSRSRKIVLSEDLSKLDFDRDDPTLMDLMLKMDKPEIEILLKITATVILSVDIFKKPRVIVRDCHEFTVQLYR